MKSDLNRKELIHMVFEAQQLLGACTNWGAPSRGGTDWKCDRIKWLDKAKEAIQEQRMSKDRMYPTQSREEESPEMLLARVARLEEALASS